MPLLAMPLRAALAVIFLSSAQAHAADTIKVGIRSTHEDTRTSQMPAFGKDGILNQAQISNVADHVLSLSSGKGDNEEGAALFKQNCSACHGPEGKGNRSMGAPNLSDGIWLYGGTKADIMAQVTNPRHGVALPRVSLLRVRLPERFP